MERGTWDALLSFLLAINDALLSPPAVKGNAELFGRGWRGGGKIVLLEIISKRLDPPNQGRLIGCQFISE